MAYDASTGILTAPFTKIAANGQGDLQNALGRTTCYSEIQLIADVDGSGNPTSIPHINKWAFYKPVKQPILRPLTNAERKAVKCGLTVDYFNHPDTLRNAFDSQWAYDQPRSASASTPLRASDFVENNNSGQIITTGTRGGYNAKASAPIYGWLNKPQGTYYIGRGGVLAAVGMLPHGETPPYSVQLSDIIQGSTSFGDMYIGIMLFRGSSLPNSTYVGLKTFSEEGSGVSRNISWMEAQQNFQNVDIRFSDSDFAYTNTNYYFMPVISFNASVTLDGGPTKYEAGVYACPGCDIATMAIKPADDPSAQNVALVINSTSFAYASGGYRVSIGATLWGVNTAVNNAYIYYDLYEGDSATGTPVATGDFYNYLTDGTIPVSPGKTKSFSYTRRASVPSFVTIVLTDYYTHYVYATITMALDDEL